MVGHCEMPEFVSESETPLASLLSVLQHYSMLALYAHMQAEKTLDGNLCEVNPSPIDYVIQVRSAGLVETRLLAKHASPESGRPGHYLAFF
jgi:hypothetical protein